MFLTTTHITRQRLPTILVPLQAAKLQAATEHLERRHWWGFSANARKGAAATAPNNGANQEADTPARACKEMLSTTNAARAAVCVHPEHGDCGPAVSVSGAPPCPAFQSFPAAIVASCFGSPASRNRATARQEAADGSRRSPRPPHEAPALTPPPLPPRWVPLVQGAAGAWVSTPEMSGAATTPQAWQTLPVFDGWRARRPQRLSAAPAPAPEARAQRRPRVAAQCAG
jgi:hypothetical protein